MGKSSDQLREEIDAQRADAGAKIDHLQQQVQDQVDSTRQQVTDTATEVRDEAQAIVTDTVDSVKQTVEDLDFEKYVRERPLASVGAALLGGLLLGSLLGGDDNQHRHNNNFSSNAGASDRGSYSGGSGSNMGSTLRSAMQKSGLEDTISNAGAALMGTVTEQLKDMVDRNFPGFSDKLDSAQGESGSFTDKARMAQQDAQKQ